VERGEKRRREGGKEEVRGSGWSERGRERREGR